MPSSSSSWTSAATRPRRNNKVVKKSAEELTGEFDNTGFNTKLFNNYSLQMYLEQFDKQKQQLYLQNILSKCFDSMNKDHLGTKQMINQIVSWPLVQFKSMDIKKNFFKTIKKCKYHVENEKKFILDNVEKQMYSPYNNNNNNNNVITVLNDEPLIRPINSNKDYNVEVLMNESLKKYLKQFDTQKQQLYLKNLFSKCLKITNYDYLKATQMMNKIGSEIVQFDEKIDLINNINKKNPKITDVVKCIIDNVDKQMTLIFQLNSTDDLENCSLLNSNDSLNNNELFTILNEELDQSMNSDKENAEEPNMKDYNFEVLNESLKKYLKQFDTQKQQLYLKNLFSKCLKITNYDYLKATQMMNKIGSEIVQFDEKIDLINNINKKNPKITDVVKCIIDNVDKQMTLIFQSNSTDDLENCSLLNSNDSLNNNELFTILNEELDQSMNSDKENAEEPNMKETIVQTKNENVLKRKRKRNISEPINGLKKMYKTDISLIRSSNKNTLIVPQTTIYEFVYKRNRSTTSKSHSTIRYLNSQAMPLLPPHELMKYWYLKN